MKPASNPRALELLAERAMRPLDDKEHWELHELGDENDESFDLAAASVALALTPIEPLPAHLADKLLASAPGFDTMRTMPGQQMPGGILPGQLRTMPGVVAPEIGTRRDMPAPQVEPAYIAPYETQPTGQHALLPTPPEHRPAPTDIERMREKKRSRASVIIPWLAAAACLALAIGAVIWATNKEPVTKIVVKEPPAKNPPTLAEQREQLLASASDVTKIEWTATTDPTATGAKGDVVWSQKEQKGYMRFTGLAVNDIKTFQYQLWIFDKNRDDKYPVDGGVFDVTSTGEVIVPITAKIPVSEATLFAVTVEKPGGVVVSSRERIVVTAARKV